MAWAWLFFRELFLSAFRTIDDKNRRNIFSKEFARSEGWLHIRLSFGAQSIIVEFWVQSTAH